MAHEAGIGGDPDEQDLLGPVGLLLDAAEAHMQRLDLGDEHRRCCLNRTHSSTR